MMRKRTAVLISGRGSNMAALVAAAPRPGYPGRDRARARPTGRARPGSPTPPSAGIATAVVDAKASPAGREAFEAAVNARLDEAGVEIVCLAGFMRLLSEAFVERWLDRLINIHPSLLPAFPRPQHARPRPGSRHQGPRLHGPFRARRRWTTGRSSRRRPCPCFADDDADSLAARVLAAEHRIFPEALALVASDRTRVVGRRVVIADAAPDRRRPGAHLTRRAVNYRHAFHAGNFADVVKHAVLALLVEHLKQKDTAFRVIDTHAGAGLYDLTASEAARTGEWRDGIGRVWDAQPDPPLAALLAPYLDAVRAANDTDALVRYPGSPWIARHLLRRQDRLTAVELHPEDAAALSTLFAGDVQARTIALDGWLALGAFLPPKERRGLVLVDPPYEARDDFDRLLRTFLVAEKRWPTGIYALWYPVKDLHAVDRFRLGLSRSGVRRLLRAELSVRARDADGTFNGAGLVIHNPPWRFAEALAALLAGLTPILARDAGAAHVVDKISGE